MYIVCLSVLISFSLSNTEITYQIVQNFPGKIHIHFHVQNSSGTCTTTSMRRRSEVSRVTVVVNVQVVRVYQSKVLVLHR